MAATGSPLSPVSAVVLSPPSIRGVTTRNNSDRVRRDNDLPTATRPSVTGEGEIVEARIKELGTLSIKSTMVRAFYNVSPVAAFSTVDPGFYSLFRAQLLHQHISTHRRHFIPGSEYLTHAPQMYPHQHQQRLHPRFRVFLIRAIPKRQKPPTYGTCRCIRSPR